MNINVSGKFQLPASDRRTIYVNKEMHIMLEIYARKKGVTLAEATNDLLVRALQEIKRRESRK